MNNTENKLELKHLAIAFSNNQKVLYFDDERELSQICKIVELKEDEATITNGEYQYEVSFNEIQLICLPLSDLTKEIEVNGEKFVPIDYSPFEKSKEHIIEFQNRFAHYKSVKFGIIERLLEWHFDIHGLIEQGLAIDKNTLP